MMREAKQLLVGLVTILVIAVVLILVAGCATPRPYWQRRCTHSHEELQAIPTFDPSTETMTLRYQWDDVCDVWDSTWVVPDTTRRR